MAEKLLKLSTLAPERPQVDIDGKRYALKAPEELTPRDQAFIVKMHRRMQDTYTAMDEESITEELAGEMEALVRDSVQRFSHDLPDEVIDSLSFEAQMKVLDFFMSHMPKISRDTEGSEPKPERKETGEKLSLPFSDSTTEPTQQAG